LLLDQLRDRAALTDNLRAEAPVPVRFNVAGWDGGGRFHQLDGQPIANWLRAASKEALALGDEDYILPVLDGLDEMDPLARCWTGPSPRSPRPAQRGAVAQRACGGGVPRRCVRPTPGTAWRRRAPRCHCDVMPVRGWMGLVGSTRTNRRPLRRHAHRPPAQPDQPSNRRRDGF